MASVIVVSVVRDMSMYERCLRGNPFLAGAELCPIDNREKNESIPACYNRFIKSRPGGEEAWYVFCHEDFEMRERLVSLVESLDKMSLWGPIGAVTRVRWFLYHKWLLLGQVEESKKDGSCARYIGEPVACGTTVETFDCQCLVVHSSLVQASKLAFDENLTFDLYVEDFCMAAAKKGIASRVCPMDAHHWSMGSLGARYLTQEAYINNKYPLDCFTGTASRILGGAPSFGRRLTVGTKRFVRKFHDTVSL